MASLALDVWHITGLPDAPDAGLRFHFGQQGLGVEATASTMPSDSLFGAVCVQWQALFGTASLTELLAGFVARRPPFMLTSTFPRVGKLCFFPKPQGTHFLQSEQKTGKELKKIGWLSLDTFQAACNRTLSLADTSGTARLQSGEMLYQQAEKALLPADIKPNCKFWRIDKRPRVTIDRLSQQSNYYQVGIVEYAAVAGLWFGVQWTEHTSPTLQAQFAAVLDALGSSGLGGERSAGFGGCRIVPAEQTFTFPLPEPDSRSYWVSLSRYFPLPQELDGLQAPDAAYQIEVVTGWLTSYHDMGQRRRSLNMLAAGSRFAAQQAAAPFGQLIDVSPRYGEKTTVPHPVWRNGFAVAVPCSPVVEPPVNSSTTQISLGSS